MSDTPPQNLNKTKQKNQKTLTQKNLPPQTTKHTKQEHVEGILSKFVTMLHSIPHWSTRYSTFSRPTSLHDDLLPAYFQKETQSDKVRRIIL